MHISIPLRRGIKLLLFSLAALAVLVGSALSTSGAAYAHGLASSPATTTSHTTPYCAPVGGAITNRVVLLYHKTAQVPADSGHVANFHTDIYANLNSCGTVTEVKAHCQTTAVPTTSIFQNCVFEKNDTPVWTPGLHSFVGGTIAQESGWYLVGSSGSKWSVAMASQVVWSDFVAESAGWPHWGVWSYWWTP